MEASSLASCTISDPEHRGACSYLGFREIFNLSPGKHFAVETDHKPLVPLLSSKLLGDLTPRNPSTPAQDDQVRFLHLSCTWDPTSHSRCIVSRASKAQVEEVTELEEEVEAFIDGVVAALLPATRVQRHTGKRSDMCEGARDL